MKSYFQGLITGGVAIASFLVFMGQTTLDKQIKEQLKELESLQSGIDILGKSMSKSINDEPQLKLVLNDNQTIVQLNTRFEKLDQKLSFIYQNLDKKIDRGIQSSEDNNGILQDIYTDGLPCNK